MKCVDVDNMTASEIRTQRDELINQCRSDSPAELSRRFVLARLDAKQRDERMAEMGAEITAIKESVLRLQKELQDRNKQLSAAVQELRRQAGVIGTLQDANTLLSQQKSEAEKAAVELLHSVEHKGD